MRYRTVMDVGTRPIRFLHRGRVVQATGLPPTTTVLTWLREHAACTGTKEGCNEGDCGACTVAVAERQPDGAVTLRNLNACLLFMPALDGKALFSVEDLTGLCSGQLHPVQQALVDHHGSQCGFCTPGFVMTMWTQWEAAQHTGVVPSRQEWADALAGNLCRCTGYRPILDAAQACVSQPAANGAIDRKALSQALQALVPSPALEYAAHDPAQGEVRRFSTPQSSDDLAACLQAHPHARVLGGATDIALWTNKAHRDVGHLIYTGRAVDLTEVREHEGWMRIGGAVSLEVAWARLSHHWPTLHDVWRRFASPPIRHAGTMAGNVANGSPIGDAPPVLMALGARLVLRQGSRRRKVWLDAFYLGYQRKDLQPGEFIEWIEVPLPKPGQVLHAWKVSKRYDSDISAVCAGFGLHFAADTHGQWTRGPSSKVGGTRLQDVTIAYGGLAATVQRARAAEQALMQAGWTQDGIAAAQLALAQDFQPLTDLRATAAYRLEAARALLQRLWWSLESAGSLVASNDSQSPAKAPGSVGMDPGAAMRVEVWR